MAELKPCPFCGGEALLGTWRDEHKRLNPSVVHCSVCHVETRIYDRKKDAIEAWNRRTKVEVNIYDKEEIYPNCTVQVLTNTVTGGVSVGWWKNGGADE